MSEHGAVLQSYNQELVKYIERLKNQKEKLAIAIEKEEEEKIRLLESIEKMNVDLNIVNASLNEKIKTRDECDRTLGQAEAGLTKIIESSRVLLSLVQQESESFSAI